MKTKLDVRNCLYPLPTTLVGATVDGKPNYIAIAHVGVMALKHVSLSMNKRHYTNAGIAANGAFSVNIPSVEMVEKTDYCGLVSGKNVDKSALFETFYGAIEAAPMIAECPVNMACQLVKTVDMGTHDVFVGEVVEVYCDEACLVDGVVDFSQVNPILFVMNDRSYWQIGKRFAKAWQAGKALR